SRPHPPEALGPAGHFRLSRIKRVELVGSPRELPQFEFHAGHGIQLVVPTPDESDHLPRMPAALFQVPVGSGIAGHHVIAAAEELQRHARGSSAEMRAQLFRRHIFTGQVPQLFPDNVFRQDGKLAEILPVANVLTVHPETAKQSSVIGDVGFGVRQKRAQVPELVFTHFFRRAEGSALNLFQHPQPVEPAQPAGESQECVSEERAAVRRRPHRVYSRAPVPFGAARRNLKTWFMADRWQSSRNKYSTRLYRGFEALFDAVALFYMQEEACF